MLCVRTLSVFLPSLFNSAVDWHKPGAAHKATSATHARIFFINDLRLGWKSPRRAAKATHEHRMAATVCPDGMRVKRLHRIAGQLGRESRFLGASEEDRRQKTPLG